MMSDLDDLMAENGIDWLVLLGKVPGNSSTKYMLSGAELMWGTVVKKVSQVPVLIHSPIERDQAEKTGLELKFFNDFGQHEIQKKEPDPVKVEVKVLGNIFDSLGVEGTVAFHGLYDPGKIYRILDSIVKKRGLTVYSGRNNIIEDARETKDEEEIRRIRTVANKVSQIIDLLRDRLSSLKEEDGRLVNQDGKEVTIGELKVFLRVEMLRRGLMEEDNAETILSIARDSAVPHNHGTNTDTIKPGKSIILDIFPREIGGGYFFDCTRTFCLGYVPERLQKVFNDVFEVQEIVTEALEPDTPAKTYNDLACDKFEAKGYSTLRKNPKNFSGFVHSLGHGIGLDIHEKPFLSSITDEIRKGSVFTNEPGLYFPEERIGVRIEDVIWITPEGELENLSPISKELLIKV